MCASKLNKFFIFTFLAGAVWTNAQNFLQNDNLEKPGVSAVDTRSRPYAADTDIQGAPNSVIPNLIWDDFKGGFDSWKTMEGWSFQFLPTQGISVLAVDTQGDLFAWKTNIALASSWAVETQIKFNKLYNDGNWTGTAGFALAGTNLNLLVLSDMIYSQDRWIYPGMGYWTGAWNDLLSNHPWVPGATNLLTLRLERPSGKSNLIFTIKTQSGFRKEYISRVIPDPIWNQIKFVGLRGFKANVAFSYLAVESPLPPTLELNFYPGLTLRGEPGTTYRIQSTTPIAPSEWVDITNVTLSSSSAFWVDRSSTNNQRRFYRAVQLP